MAILQRILNLLESFRGKAQVQNFLRSKEVPYSGTWEVVRNKIQEGIDTGKITEAELIVLLEDIEEHGDQYVYLYNFDPAQAIRIQNRAALRALLSPDERERVLDRVAIVENPSAAPSLVSAQYSTERIKLKWVQKRVFRKPLGESIAGNIATVRYEIIPTRAIDLAILDFAQHKAMLCIQKIEPGVRDYKKQLAELFHRISRFVDSQALTALDFISLMRRMDQKAFTEIRRRRYRALDANGGTIDVMSPTESQDIYDGGLYEVGRDNYTGAVASLHVNVYWIPTPPAIEREIHTIFPYRQAVNSVVFTQKCTKTERDYVLSRIETIAKGQP